MKSCSETMVTYSLMSETKIIKTHTKKTFFLLRGLTSPNMHSRDVGFPGKENDADSVMDSTFRIFVKTFFMLFSSKNIHPLKNKFEVLQLRTVENSTVLSPVDAKSCD